MVLGKSPHIKLQPGKFPPNKLPPPPPSAPRKIPIKFLSGILSPISFIKRYCKRLCFSVSHLTLPFVHKRGEEGVYSLSFLDDNV